jgi:hypothetical protein
MCHTASRGRRRRWSRGRVIASQIDKDALFHL